jgi:putative protein kinase ArgK-like GTPase of G3E family
VVNKSDLPGSQRVSRDLRSNVLLAPKDEGARETPIVLTSSTEGSGFGQLLDSIDKHYASLEAMALLPERKARIARSELQRAIDRRIRELCRETPDWTDNLVRAIANREISPDEASQRILVRLAQDLERR